MTLKRLIFVFTVSSVFACKLNAQVYNEAELDLMIGKKVQPKPVEEEKQSFYYRNFYTTFDTIEKVLRKTGDDSHPFEVSNGYKALSDYDSLRDKEFIVKKVYRQKPKGSFDKAKYYVLELYNSEYGTMYYEYSTSFQYEMEIALSEDLELSPDHYCKNIRTEDSYEDTVKYYTPEVNGLTLLKFESTQDTLYYMVYRDEINQETLEDTKLYMLLRNGKILEFPDARLNKVDVGNGFYQYSFSVELPQSALEKFLDGVISDIGYAKYSTNFNPKESQLLSAYLHCLLNMKD